jgi:cytochrome P450
MTSPQHASPTATAPVAVCGHAAVVRALADPRYQVPPAATDSTDAPERGVAWLRASVARFANGETHARRRAYVTARLAALRPDDLRDAARRETETTLTRTALWAASRPTASDAAHPHGTVVVDVMAALARRVPLRVVAAALGVPDADLDRAAAATARAAAAYHPTADADTVRRADPAVADLAALFAAAEPHAGPEDIANLIGILVQTCESTAGLVGNTAAAALRLPPAARAIPVERLVGETLRHDPPVRATLRRTTEPLSVDGTEHPPGTTVALDFAAANRDPAVFPAPDAFDPDRPAAAPGHLTFGAGPRPCPGSAHALALACGVLEPLLTAAELAEPDAETAYQEPGNPRVPARLDVRIPTPHGEPR